MKLPSLPAPIARPYSRGQAGLWVVATLTLLASIGIEGVAPEWIHPGQTRFAGLPLMLLQALILAGGWLRLGVRGERSRQVGRGFWVLSAILSILAAKAFRPWSSIPWTGNAPLPWIPATTVLATALAALVLDGATDRRRINLGATLAMVPTALSSFVLLEFVAGVPDFFSVSSFSVASALQFVTALMAGTGLVMAAGVTAWPLSSFRQEAPRSGNATLAWGPFFLFQVGIVIAGLAGAIHFRSDIKETRRSQRSELRAIASLKAHQLADWYLERDADARLAGTSDIVQGPLVRYLDGTMGAAHDRELHSWLQALRGGTNYSALLLYDRAGRTRLALPGDAAPDTPPPAAFLQYPEESSPTPLIFGQASGGAYFAQWIPIKHRGGGKPLGFLELRTDPEKTVIPLLGFWPNPGSSAVTFLLHRKGMGAAQGQGGAQGPHLEILAGRPGATPSQVPADLILNGHDGFLELQDPRGIPVLVSLTPVPGTPWVVMVQIGQFEILGPVQTNAVRDYLFFLGIIVALALAFRAWLRDREQERLGIQLATSRERKVLEDRLDLLMRRGSDILFLLDPGGSILDANARAVETYGLPVEALRGKPIKTFRTAGEAPDFEEAFRVVRDGTSTRYETVHQRGEGIPFPVEVRLSSVILGEELFIAAFIRDITEQKRKANELLRLNRLYATLSQINQAILGCGTPVELFELVARILVETGQFRMAWIGLHTPGLEAACAFDSLRAPDLLGAGLPRLDLARGGQALAAGDTIILNRLDGPDGRVPWHGAASSYGIAAAAGIPVQLGTDSFGGLVVFAEEEGFFGQEEIHLLDEAARDVAFALHQFEKDEVRKQAEAALRENEKFLTQAQEVGLVGIYSFDILGNRWEASPFLDRLFGIPPDYPRTMESWLDLVEPSNREAMRVYLEGVVREGMPFDREYPIVRHEDSEIRWLHGRGEMIPGDSGASLRMVGVIQDITLRVSAEQERRDLEGHLQQVQQLESLGILAGGIAHDMNNVLAAIMALASIQAGSADPGSSLAKAMDTIIKASNRGREVVKGILFFARRKKAEVSDLDLNAVVRDISQLLSYTTLKRVGLQMDLDPDLGTIRADEVAIAHALMNLCVNAVDAMPGGGTLLIRTGQGPGGSIDLEVRDTGDGMPPEVLKRALEPFYTTKPAGKGTGLGLAIVSGTMQAHDGELLMTSRPGVGTSAVLRFPESRKVRGGVLHAPAPLPFQVGRAFRILLVEDDPLVQATTSELLNVLGHQVEVAGNGLEAIEWLEQGNVPDVIILDMNMPVLNGAQALPRILKMRPDQNVIVVTGYLDAGIQAILAEFPSVVTLEKPFSIRELEAKVSMLSGPGAPFLPSIRSDP